MFTYEWLGLPTESGIQPVLDRSATLTNSLTTAVDQAKMQLNRKSIFRAGEICGVRIFDYNHTLVWAGNISDD